MNEVGAEGKGESVWLGWFLHAVLSEWAGAGRRARGGQARPSGGAAYASALRSRSSARPGTATGIGARTSTMGRRSAPPSTTRAASIRSPSPGASSRRRPTRRAGARHGGRRRTPRASRRRRRPAPHAAVRRHVRWSPATSRAMCPASERMAGSTRMRRSGRRSPSRRSATGTRPPSSSRCLNPINHASTAASVAALQGRAVRRRGGRLRRAAARRPRRLDVVHGISGVDVSGPGLESILGFRLRGTQLVIDPCIPGAWRGFEMVFRYRSARYDLSSRTPEACRGACRQSRSMASLAGDLSIRLVDDGKTHRVRIVLG